MSGPPLSHQGSVKYADYNPHTLLMVMGQEWATHRLRERNCYWEMEWRNTVMLLCISSEKEENKWEENGLKGPLILGGE